jgi:hypothetical protein
VGVKGHVVLHGEVYAVETCPRREIVRAWRGAGVSVAMLVSALAHPGDRLVPIGEDPPDAGIREPRRPQLPGPSSGVALGAPPIVDLPTVDFSAAAPAEPAHTSLAAA